MNTLTRDHVQVGDRHRTYTLIGPPNAHTLVLVFHGSRQTGDQHREFFGRVFDQLADHKVAVAYLDGYRGNWNDARRHVWFRARTANVDDVGFARAVADKVGAQTVFAVGYSNGGHLVFRLMHEAPDLISGAAVFAATMPTPDNFLLPATPGTMPVLLSHGTADPIVSYHGGPVKWLVRKVFKVGGDYLSMPRTAEYFAAHNGITAPPVSTKLLAQSTDTFVERTEYRDDGRPPVVLYTVHGGGHTVPHPGRASTLVVGPTSRDVDSAHLVSELFGLSAPVQGPTSS